MLPLMYAALNLAYGEGLLGVNEEPFVSAAKFAKFVSGKRDKFIH